VGWFIELSLVRNLVAKRQDHLYLMKRGWSLKPQKP